MPAVSPLSHLAQRMNWRSGNSGFRTCRVRVVLDRPAMLRTITALGLRTARGAMLPRQTWHAMLRNAHRQDWRQTMGRPAAGKLAAGMLGVFNQFFSDSLSEKTKSRRASSLSYMDTAFSSALLTVS